MKTEDARKFLEAYEAATEHFKGDKDKAKLWLFMPNPILDSASRSPFELINSSRGNKVLREMMRMEQE